MSRLLFIKIPKTGSTFFEKNFLLKEADFDGVNRKIWSVGHSWSYPTQIKGWLDWDYPKQEPGIFRDVMVHTIEPNDRIITMIRNPFALLFSYFNYDWAWCRRYHNLPEGEYTIEDFQKFVDIYLNRSVVFHAPAFRKSLFSQLKDVNGNWILKDDSIVLRFENLKDDIDGFCNTYGLEVTNNSDTAKNEAKQSKPCQWWEAYRDDQIEKLNVLWKEDLDYFGYSFENPTKKKDKSVKSKKVDCNLKIALCFSGEIRDLERTKDYWTDMIKKYDMDVYASFWDTSNVELGDTVDNFYRIYNAKKVEVESFETFDKSTLSILRKNIKSPESLMHHLKESCNRFGTMAMWYKIWRANLLTKMYNVDYDVVIRVRTDILFDEKMVIENNNMLNVPFGRVTTQNWKNSDGIADLFAYGSPQLMDYYSTCFFYMMEHINDGNYMVPHEHFLTTHMNRVSVPVRFMDSKLTITRTSRNGEDEVYYKSNDMYEEILKSDSIIKINPNPDLSFKDDIKKNLKF